MNDTTENDDMQALIAELMRQEKCSAPLASHMISRVAMFLGVDDVQELLSVLRKLEAETRSASHVCIPRSRLMRAFFDCAIVALLPEARAALSTIIEYARHVALVKTQTH